VNRNTDVIVLQEYIPDYRIPFFRLVGLLAQESGFSVTIAAGRPAGSQAKRGNAATLMDAKHIRQLEIQIAGRRVTMRKVGSAVLGAKLIVVEQARRNLDTYRLFLPHRQKIALWGHGWDHTQTPGAIDRKLLDALTRRCDWFFGYTEESVDYVVSIGVDRRITTAVQNSTDTRQLQADLANVTTADLDSWNLQHDLRGRTALFLGGVDRSKRTSLLFESALSVYRQNSDFRLLVAGAGEDIDSAKAFAEDNPWCKVLGRVTGERLALTLKSADVLAIPGRVGLVAVDSLAAATPIVTVASSKHAPEFSYLNPGVNCVVTADDSDAYATGLYSSVFDRQRLNDLQRACIEPSKVFSIEEMARRFVEGLKKALNRSPNQ
jgi:glycosyltransferase involved in cell wall biosynthesis